MMFPSAIQMLKLGQMDDSGPTSVIPVASAATNVGTNAFTANVIPGSNNTGVYWIDVFLADGVTYVGSWNNVQFSALSKLVNTGIFSLTQYKYQFRAGLNIIVEPTPLTDASFQQLLSVTYVNGSSGEIAAVINAIADSTSTNKYKVTIEGTAAAPKTYNEGNFTGFGNYVSMYAQENYGVILNSSGGTSNVFDVGGHTMTIKGFDIRQANPNKYGIHIDSTPGAAITIVRNCKMTSTGLAFWGAAGGLYANQHIIFIDCEMSSEIKEGCLFHGHSQAESGGSTAGRSLIFIRCKMRTGNGALTDFLWENRGSGSTTDFVAFYNCDVRSVVINNNGGGAGETYFYFDPSCGTVDITAVDPSKVLNTADFTDFLVNNNLSISENSNQISVTTASEGNLLLDNYGDTVALALSTEQLKSAYVGPLVSSDVDTDPVTTFYDQSGNGRNGTEGTNPPVYSANGLGAGLPGLVSVNSPASQLSLAAALATGTDFDLIAVFKRTGNLSMFNGDNVPGMYHASSTLYHFTATGGFVSKAQAINTTNNHALNIRRRNSATVEFLLDGVSLGTGDLTGNVSETIQYLLNDLHGDNTAAIIAAMVVLIGATNTQANNFVTAAKTKWNIA